MTHDDVVSLLPVYVLGALDEDVAGIEAHLRECSRCRAALAAYRETTATLGEAVEPVSPPTRLRTAVLASLPERPARRRLLSPWLPRLPSRRSLVAIAALVLLAIGLGASYAIQAAQLQATRRELALDQQGLVLLTSTETIVERLAPSASLGAGTNSHGHWYHQPGIDTQILVVEFMPSLPPGESYEGWSQDKNGAWHRAGSFTLDNKGYGRLILLGSDGSTVGRVVVTRQAGVTTTPVGEIVLSWPN